MNVNISHKEYIQDVISSGTTLAFSITKIPINPGLAQSFPWLSGLAANYQYYRLRNLTVIYEPTCATAIANSSNVAYGFVLLRAVHDVTIATDVNEQQMDCSYETVRGVAYQRLRLGVEKKVSTIKERSIRYGVQATNTDLRFYDDMYIEVASSGVVATTQTLGKLYFSYDIELIRPQLQGGLIGNQLLNAHYKINVATATNQLGTSQTQIYDGIGLSFTTPATCNAFAFPSWIQSGNWCLIYTLNGTSNGSCQAPLLNVTNASILGNFQGSSAQMGFTAPHNGTEETATAVCSIFFVNVTGSAPTFTYGSGNNMPSSTAYSDLFVIQSNGLMLT